MMKKNASYIICLAVLFGMIFPACVLAEISVGVTKGDVIEYQVTCTGNVPDEHNVDSAKIEVTGVDGTQIDIKLTSTYPNGTQTTDTTTLNLQTGQIGDSFIIPANLSNTDTFIEQTEGTITISAVEERTYADAKRTVVTATTTHNMFYWDQATGFLLEATSTYSDFTITTKAENTNIWQSQAFGIDPIFPIVLLAVTIGAVLAILLKTRK
ncbi:MAG: hypothetical protein NWF06_05700 [Candidatus Bathyarchaeota archaeon]|nr:hypothetical protein [Candidatus Bathyarchaeum sp.]